MTGAPGRTLRPAGPDDALAIAGLHVAAWREAYQGIVPDAMLAGLSVEDRAATWRRVLLDSAGHGGAAVLLAYEDGALLGFGSCGAQRTPALEAQGYAGEVTTLYVLRSAQGQGVGTALFAALAQALLRQGHAGGSLWVLVANAPARRFYERRGGRALDRREEARPDATLFEVAYGWPDLTTLLRP